MESKINKQNSIEGKKFPLLAKYRNTELVVLFTSKNVGMVVVEAEDGSYPIGEYRTDWVISQFNFIEESVTLKN